MLVPRKNVSLQLWSVRDKFNGNRSEPKVVLDQIKKMGIASLELAGTANRNPREFADVIKDSKMHVVGIHMPPLVRPLDDKYTAFLDEMASHANLFGCKSIVTMCNVFEDLNRDSYIRYAELCVKVSDLLAKRDPEFRVSYHCYFFDLVGLSGGGPSEAGLDVLMQNTDAKTLGFQLDTYFAARFAACQEDVDNTDVVNSTLLTLLDTLGPRCSSIHLNDMNGKGEKCPLGYGVIDWQAIIKKQKACSPNAAIILEQDSRNTYGDIAKSLAFLETNTPAYRNREIDFKIEGADVDTKNAAYFEHTGEVLTEVFDTCGAEIDGAFRSNIFPGDMNTSRQRSPKEAPLYVSQRLDTETGSKESPAASEERLYSLCMPLHSHKPAIVYVRGVEGVGKTTFLRYFCSMYFPQCYVRQATGSSHGEHPEPIFLYADIQRLVPVQDARKKVLEEIKKSLKQHKQFSDISTRDACAMWHRKLDWDDAIHPTLSGPDLLSYRRRKAQPYFSQLDDLVPEALWYLSNLKQEDGSPKYGIVIVLDNVDQVAKLSIEAAATAVTTAIEWLERQVDAVPSEPADNEINLSRLIIPMRPETSRLLAPSLDPLDNWDQICLGPPEAGELFAIRGKEAENAIRTSGRMIERTVQVGVQKDQVFSPISCADAVRQIRLTITDNLQRKTSAGSVEVNFKEGETAKLLDDLCDNRVRRWLYLRKRLAVSHSFQRDLENKLASRATLGSADKKTDDHVLVTDYIHLNGVLTGPSDLFHAEDHDRLFLNLFALGEDMGEDNKGAHSRLVGYHMASYLSKHNSVNRAALFEDLTQSGHSIRDLEKAEKWLENAGCFHRRPIGNDQQLDMENRILNAHVALAAFPAYLDNMAIVTPVDSIWEEQIARTVSYVNGQFLMRAKSTFAFLRQLRSDEITVSTWTQSDNKGHDSFDSFKEAFNRLNLPSIYRKAAVAYRTRLTGLKISRGVLERLSEDAWMSLLREQVMQVREEDVGQPLRATNGGNVE